MGLAFLADLASRRLTKNNKQKAVLQGQTNSHIADLSRVCETIKGWLYPDGGLSNEQFQLLATARNSAAEAMRMLEALEECL